MKKHDEGYVLPFVLIAVLVISLVIASVMTIPLRNLRSQQAVIERMQDRYQTEGAIEKFEALMTDEEGLKDLTGGTGKSETEAIKSKINAVCISISGDSAEDEYIPQYPADTTVDKEAIPDEAIEKFTYTFEVTSVYGTAKITSEIVFSGLIKKGTSTDSYTITEPKITYKTYEISTGGDAS